MNQTSNSGVNDFCSVKFPAMNRSRISLGMT